MSDHIKRQHEAGMLSIILNRPDTGNLVSVEMIHDLTRALRSVPNDVRLIVLKAEGNDFCKGRDYGTAPEDARQGKGPSAGEILDRMTGPIINLYAAIKETSVPTLSVVQGTAAGFGCALACACDIVLASDEALFSMPEMHERGLPPSLAMTALLDRINIRTLTYLVYGTQPIEAMLAVSMGMISAVEPRQSLQSRAKTLATHICSQPGDSIRAVKSYLKLAPRMDPVGRAALGASLYAIVAGSR